MNRKRDSLGTRMFACAMSLILAVGLMPLPAYAETGGESTEAPLVIGSVVGDESAAGDSGSLRDAENGESYFELSWNAQTKTVESTTKYHEATSLPSSKTIDGGWYYLNSNVTVKDRVTFQGDTHLILKNGCTLDVKGLHVKVGSKLTIYAQSQAAINAGTINSHPSSGPAISGDVTIHGGNITAKGAKHCAGIGSNDGATTFPITIYGGKINAKGGSDGAGIGGGRDSDGGTITIYGGDITANGGGENGASIGGGDSAAGGNITIWGGTFTLNEDPNEDGAAIGGGDGGDGGNITINGGTITAYHRDGAGIGGGEDGDGGNITINGGEIHSEPKGMGNGTGIGGGNHSGAGGKITITGGTVYANSTRGAGIGGGQAKDTFFLAGPDNSGAGGTINISGGEVHVSSQYAYGIGAGGNPWDEGSVPLDSQRIGSAGHVTISGSAVVHTNGFQAGIGGDGGDLTIAGGTVYTGGLESKHMGYGIQYLSDKAKVNISGGTVTATGYDEFPGISTLSGTFRISGGSVYAYADKGSAIGGRDGKFADGTLIIEGDGTFVSASSTRGIGIGAHNVVDSGTWVFRPGITVEVTTGEVSTKLDDNTGTIRHFNTSINYEGARITAGKTKETAEALQKGEKDSAYKEYEYRLIEPCDHEGTIENNQCRACGYIDEATYVEYSWANEQLTSQEKTAADPTEMTSSSSINAGWYFLNKNITIDNRLSLGTGDTHLILGDGYKLNVKGIYIPQGSTLHVYGQTAGTGKLISKPSTGAGIGGYSGHNGGNIVIHGGIVEATGANHCAGIGSNDGQGNNNGSFTMYNGTVKATGGSNGAGIGGGQECNAGMITIYGGEVTATGKNDSAGIGGGDSDDSSFGNAGSITIYGGTVTAKSSGSGAAIGGADYGTANVTIQGGDVTATCSGNGKGIGGGSKLASDASTISLGYTEATKADIGITASSYGGTVTLSQPFHNSYGLFEAGEQHNLATMAKGTLVPWTDEAVTWRHLQQLIDGTNNGETLTLERDFNASASDEALKISSGKNLTIDLNGHTLNFKTGDYNADPVIKVEAGATLTIEDSEGNGVITGGDADNGGDIYCAGTLIMNGGTITGNKATKQGGGGIYVAEGASFTMNGGVIKDNTSYSYIEGGGNGGGVYCAGTMTITGGVIKGNTASAWGGGIYLADGTNATLNLNGGSVMSNTCDSNKDSVGNGGGVHVSGSAAISVSGAPVVKGNKRIAEPDNLYLAKGANDSDGAIIAVTGELSEVVTNENGETIDEFTADIYLARAAGAGIFTSGYDTHNTELPRTYFHANRDDYTVVLSNGEARIDESVAGVQYSSYEWTDEGLVETALETDDSKWTAFPSSTSVPAGKYVVNKDITVNDRVSLGGNTEIVLTQDRTLDVKGLYIPQGSTLTIYADGDSQGEENTAKLSSHPSSGAAIGAYSGHEGGNVIIHGGTIEATGYNHCAGIGSNDGDGADTGSFTMYNGTVTAVGGSQGAGIGGGRDCDGGTIKIYGGTVTATGKDSSAGIGGSDTSGSRADNSTIEIYGGTITATGNSKGAGIGGGEYGHATITISGGTITATGGSTGGAGIGSGVDGVGSTITIAGGSVNASSASPDGYGIGNGKNREGESTVTLSYTDETKDTVSITASNYSGTVTLSKVFKSETGGSTFYPNTYTNTSALAGKTLVAYGDDDRTEVQYRNLAGVDQSQYCIPVVEENYNWVDDWYAVLSDVAITHETTVTGDVNLILADGATLTSQNIKVPVGSSLTIWGQGGGIGKVVATATHQAQAGIGGSGCDCGTITINGGTVEANGGVHEHYSSAGIGGAVNQKTGTVIINGGTVTAHGSAGAAGIGGGANEPTHLDQISNKGIIEIHGGTVNAYGERGGAGIGSGLLGSPTGGSSVDATGTILITGGTVYAHSTFVPGLADYNQYGTAAAIGGGWKSNAGTITITGGTVTANGIDGGPGLGVGYGGGDNGYDGGNITITGGAVTAAGHSKSSAAIGGGFSGGNVTINISGGAVTATSGYVGIGDGKNYDSSRYAPSAITLGYTDETFDFTSIEASSYNGKVKLEKDFEDRATGTTFAATDAVSNVSALANTTLVPHLFTVAAYTTDKNCTASVGNARIAPDSSNFKPGSSVSVTTTPCAGWTFLGWYEVKGVDGNTGLVSSYGDSPVSKELTYTFAIQEDMRLAAVFEAISQANVTIGTRNGAEYIVNNDPGSVVQTSETSWNAGVGESFKVTAVDPDKVLQWENESNKIIGRNASIDMVVTGSMRITLAYNTVEENHAFVEFVSDYGQVLSAAQYTSESPIAFPAAPSKFGYTFKYWRVEGEEATQDSIQKLIQKGATVITLKPYYEQVSETGSITVKCLHGTTELSRETYADIPYGTLKTFVANAEMDGYKFECWKDEDEKVLGYDRAYRYKVSQANYTLVASYVDQSDEIQAVPVITITEFSAIDADGTHKLSCVVSRSVPEEYTLVEHGMLYGRNVDSSKLTDSGFVYADGNGGILRYKSTDKLLVGLVRGNFKVDSDDVAVSCRGFMVLRKNGSSELEYYYTDIITKTYAELNGTGD